MKHHAFILQVIVATVILSSNVFAQTTVTLNPNNDAYVRDDDPNTNYNTTELRVGKTTSEFLQRYRAFIGFNLASIPSNATVTSATLRVNLQAYEGTSTLAIEVRRALATWNGASITWNNQPALSSTVSTTTNVGTTIGNDYSFNITSLVQSWVDGTNPNDGLALQAQNESSATKVRFFASNNHSNTGIRPELVVTYTLPPEITVTPTALSFGNRAVTSTSPPQTVTIKNDGGSTLTVPAISSGSAEFQLSNVPALPANITAGGTAIFQVSFAPSSIGEKNANITIASNDADEPTVYVSCNGTGMAPEITVAPTNLGFGNQTVNTVSAPQTVRIKNDGNANLSVTAIASNSAEFQISNGPALPANVAPGVEVSFEVRFAPVDRGQKNANITISSNDADEPNVTVTCNGTGVAPEITVTPTSLDFGNLAVGSASAPQTVTIKNDGNSPLSVHAIASTNSDFEVINAPALPVNIAGGGTATFQVRFVPASRGASNGSIKISSNDADEPNVFVDCTGTGMAPEITVTPTDLGFGNQTVNTVSAPQTVRIKNDGNANLSVTAIASNSAEFQISNGPALPANIAPGVEVSFEVRFAPVDRGQKNANITISSNDADEPNVTVTCNGTGVAPEITVTPTALNFGNQTVTATSAPQTVRIKNDGNNVLRVSAITSTDAQFAVSNGPALPANVQPGIEVTFEVRFTPAGVGEKNANIRIVSNDADEPNVFVACTGTGVLPLISFTPPRLDFGEVQIGTTSPPLTASLKNESEVTVEVDAVTSTDDDFLPVNLPVLPKPLAPGVIEPIQVVYQPDIIEEDEDCINVRVCLSNDSCFVICVPVGGIGVGPQEDLPVLLTAQASYTFCGVAVNTVSAPQPVFARNTSTQARTITAIQPVTQTIPPPPFQFSNQIPLPAVVPAGDSLKIFDMRFAPVEAGTFFCQVEITTDAPTNNKSRARFAGSAIDPNVADFKIDPRPYRLAFDKLKYANNDSVWIEFSVGSGAPAPGENVQIYLASPNQQDVERIALIGDGCYGQRNLVAITDAASNNFDGKLSAKAGDFIFAFYQPPQSTIAAADFAFIRGGMPQGLFSLDLDPVLTPLPASVPGKAGEAPRGLATITNESGYPGVFGDDQLIIAPRNLTELNDFLKRYDGRIVDDGKRGSQTHRPERHYYLVRVNLDRADSLDFEFTAELAGLRGALRTSSQRTRRLYNILACEQLESRWVMLNPRIDFFDQPRTVEGALGGGNTDAFQLGYILDCVQKVNRAWMYVAMQDRDRASSTTVRVAIIDDGFCNNPDLSLVPGAGWDLANDDGNPMGARETPVGAAWHGAAVASTAGSLLNDGTGSAGAGGQVADLMFYRLGPWSHVFEVGTAIDMAVADGAQVVNMSLGIPCRVFGSPSFCELADFWNFLFAAFACPFLDPLLATARDLLAGFIPGVVTCHELFVAMTLARSNMAGGVEDALDAGVSLVASVGNDRPELGIPDSDVSDFEIIPASLPGVIAVGAMDANYQNTEFFGDRVDVWAIMPVQAFFPPANAANCGAAPVVQNFGQTSGGSGFVAGIVALMRAVNPNLTPAEIRAMFRNANFSTPSPVDPIVQRRLDAYAVVKEAGTRAGLPDLELSPSLGFDENRPANIFCNNLWPPSNHSTDDDLNSANSLPVGENEFADRGIHTFRTNGGIEPDHYVFEVPVFVPDNRAYSLRLSTFYPTSAGDVLPRPDATIEALAGIFTGFSRATWSADLLFLRDDLYFSVQGNAANLANRDNVYILTSRINSYGVQADRYDRAPLGVPPNNTFADATLLPHIAGGDVFEFFDDGTKRIWDMFVTDLNFHNPTDVDYFCLDLPDEAGDDCVEDFFGVDCPIQNLVRAFNGELVIRVFGAREIIAYDANGNEIARDTDELRYGCPRSFGFDKVYFAVVGSAERSLDYFMEISYSVPDVDPTALDILHRMLELCNAKRDPNAPDPQDDDDSYDYVNPGRSDPQHFIFGVFCNPIVCDPPKHDYLLFNWRTAAKFEVEFQHLSGESFNFQLRDSRFNLIATAHHTSPAAASVAAISDSLVTQRIEMTLPAGFYVLRADSARIGAAYSVQFLTPVAVAVQAPEQPLPQTYLLEQNYPNPFNPATTIRYALPERAEVTLKVFDVHGREVAQLLRAVQSAGYHSVHFDAGELASGVYFYRLQARGKTYWSQTRKLVFIK